MIVQDLLVPLILFDAVMQVFFIPQYVDIMCYTSMRTKCSITKEV